MIVRDFQSVIGREAREQSLIEIGRLPDEVVEAVTATGYLRCAPDSSRPDFSTIKNADAQYFYPTINDTLQIVASSTMGLTLQCARCHSHKFDPIPQVEYYRMQSIFMTAYRPKQWVPQMDRKLFVDRHEIDDYNGLIYAPIVSRFTAGGVKYKLTVPNVRFMSAPRAGFLTHCSLAPRAPSGGPNTARVGAIYGPATETVGVLAQAMILAIGGAFVLDDQLTVGELTAFVLYVTAFFAPIQQLRQLYNT